MKKQKNVKPKKSQHVLDKEYAEFLKKKLESKNYKANVSEEEYLKTKAKYDKVKLKLRLYDA